MRSLNEHDGHISKSTMYREALREIGVLLQNLGSARLPPDPQTSTSTAQFLLKHFFKPFGQAEGDSEEIGSAESAMIEDGGQGSASITTSTSTAHDVQQID
jgi:hypothetical protein